MLILKVESKMNVFFMLFCPMNTNTKKSPSISIKNICVPIKSTLAVQFFMKT